MSHTPQNTVFVFPGQGSQIPGMSKEFMEHPATRELFQQADDALSFHLSKLMAEGPSDVLTQTENAQPALLLSGIAAFTYLVSQSGRSLSQLASSVAGHSLGEVTAVTAASGLKLTDALRLVRTRGQAMETAVPTGQGGMSAVLGLEVPAVEEVAAASGATLANDNAPGQLIIAGLIPQLMQAEDEARNRGAKRVLRLPVSGPFHTPLMAPAAEAVRRALAQTPLQPTQVSVWANVSASPEADPLRITGNLVAQVTGRVRWRETMASMANQGITQVLELGTGKVLSGLAPRIDPRLNATALESPSTVDAWLEAAFKA